VSQNEGIHAHSRQENDRVAPLAAFYSSPEKDRLRANQLLSNSRR
jgi:hypothetical protein